MPLVTMHTRLMTVLTEAQLMRRYAQDLATQLSAGPVSANVVLNFITKVGSVIAEVIHPARWHEGLEAFAVLQFNDPEFGLNARLDGMRTPLDAALATAIAIMPKSEGGYLAKDLLSPTGELTVRTLTPEQTAGLVSILQTIVTAIPE